MTDPGGFDHAAALAARPADFEQQVRACIEEIATGAPRFAGVWLHPDAPARARRWLDWHDRGVAGKL